MSIMKLAKPTSPSHCFSTLPLSLAATFIMLGGIPSSSLQGGEDVCTDCNPRTTGLSKDMGVPDPPLLVIPGVVYVPGECHQELPDCDQKQRCTFTVGMRILTQDMPPAPVSGVDVDFQLVLPDGTEPGAPDWPTTIGTNSNGYAFLRNELIPCGAGSQSMPYKYKVEFDYTTPGETSPTTYSYTTSVWCEDCGPVDPE